MEKSHILLLSLSLVAVLLCHRSTAQVLPKRNHVYLVHQIQQEGTIPQVSGQFVARSPLEVLVWRPEPGNSSKYKLKFSKTIDVEIGMRTFPFRNRNSRCLVVKPKDMVGVFSDQDKFPIEVNISVTIQGVLVRQVDRKLQNDDMLNFDQNYPHPIMFEGNIVPMSLQGITSKYVDCPVVTTAPPTTSTTPPPTTPIPDTTAETTIAQVDTVTLPGNIITTAVAAGITNNIPTGMYAGIGAVAGLLLIGAIILAVVLIRKRKSSSNDIKADKSADSNDYTTKVDRVSVKDMAPTKNAAYGMNMEFLTPPNTYQTMSEYTKRPISTHDYSPIIPKRPDHEYVIPNGSGTGTKPQPSPKLGVPMSGSGTGTKPQPSPKLGVQMSGLGTGNKPKPSPKLGVPMSGLGTGNKPQPSPKLRVPMPGLAGENKTVKPPVPDNPHTYMELMPDVDSGIAEGDVDINLSRQDSSGYEQVTPY